jgi:exodeoxyribonuclease-3
MSLRIATWNINSVRARADIVEQFLRDHQPDVLCLQETKVANDIFPHGLFEQLGYTHRILNGQRMHHGVATISRVPLEGAWRYDWQDNGEARHIGVRLPNGVLLENVYVPAGGDVPDPAANPKFRHKLDFVAEATNHFSARGGAHRTLLLGDLNIAPLEHDVWSHKQLLDVVSHTPVEVAALTAWQRAGHFVDAVRKFVPAEQKLYTWWSYRNSDWRASDRGRRLDHIWASADLAESVKAHAILKDVRDWQQGSDHVPVWVELSA